MTRITLSDENATHGMKIDLAIEGPEDKVRDLIGCVLAKLKEMSGTGYGYAYETRHNVNSSGMTDEEHNMLHFLTDGRIEYRINRVKAVRARTGKPLSDCLDIVNNYCRQYQARHGLRPFDQG